jgi:AraC family transcriptional regulator
MASAPGRTRTHTNVPIRPPLVRSSGPAFPLVNPPASQLGLSNAVYSGSGTQHDTGMVPGWLSIKTMIRGTAVWETPERRFNVDEDCYLILNDRHRYALRFESGEKVTTFVLFFRRGLAEDVLRCSTTASEGLLDDPLKESAPAEFFERLETRTSPLFRLVQRFKKEVAAGLAAADADDWFVRMASQMIREQKSAGKSMARLPGVRAATRAELFRRVLRGRDFLLSQTGERVTLGDAARAACLSPYHFHRAFRQAFGETPHDARTRYRLESAAALLAAGEQVTDVCLATGFESLGSFSSLFNRYYGTTPRDYRASHRK